MTGHGLGAGTLLVASAASGARAARASAARSSWSRPFMLRAALLVGSVTAGVVAGALASPEALGRVEPELVVLLRGMALIKGGFAAAAVALVGWRFGRPVSLQAASGYVAGTACFVAATVFIWNLDHLLAVAVAFHVALFGVLLLAWREGLAAWKPRSVGRDDRLVVRRA